MFVCNSDCASVCFPCGLGGGGIRYRIIIKSERIMVCRRTLICKTVHLIMQHKRIKILKWTSVADCLRGRGEKENLKKGTSAVHASRFIHWKG